jgi:hypothetical protein
LQRGSDVVKCWKLQVFVTLAGGIGRD